MRNMKDMPMYIFNTMNNMETYHIKNMSITTKHETHGFFFNPHFSGWVFFADFHCLVKKCFFIWNIRLYIYIYI